MQKSKIIASEECEEVEYKLNELLNDKSLKIEDFNHSVSQFNDTYVYSVLVIYTLAESKDRKY